MTEQANVELIELTSEIVAAYVTKNNVSGSELPGLIQSTYAALKGLGEPAAPAATALIPAVPVKKSVTPDFLISLEDGHKYKSLKRHLSTKGMTPEEYRAKWGLPKDYPMVAANYSAQRSSLAKSLGLGRKAAAPAVDATNPAAKSAPRGRGRAKAIKPADETFS
jgi:predicted transcriptional regulator